jgi:uncharacterized repeat protein (TIGR03803 family)
LDPSGNLFGTTAFGGNPNAGLVFELTPGSPWTETVVYRFCSQQNCTDGSAPRALGIGAGGTLYGTTSNGGASGGGTAFELEP